MRVLYTMIKQVDYIIYFNKYENKRRKTFQIWGIADSSACWYSAGRGLVSQDDGCCLPIIGWSNEEIFLWFYIFIGHSPCIVQMECKTQNSVKAMKLWLICPRTTNKMFLMWFLAKLPARQGRNWWASPASWDTWRPILRQMTHLTPFRTQQTSNQTFYRRQSRLVNFPAGEMWLWGCVRWQVCPYEEI